MLLLSGAWPALRAAYHTHVAGRQSRLCALIGYAVLFPAARGIPVIQLWLGNTTHWSAGDLYIHHVAIGTVLMLIGGALALDGLWRKTGGALFGAGAALTLDEFSLIVYVDAKSYWPIYGLLTSLVAVFVFAMLLLTVLLLGRPVISRITANAVRLMFRRPDAR